MKIFKWLNLRSKETQLSETKGHVETPLLTKEELIKLELVRNLHPIEVELLSAICKELKNQDISLGDALVNLKENSAITRAYIGNNRGKSESKYKL